MYLGLRAKFQPADLQSLPPHPGLSLHAISSQEGEHKVCQNIQLKEETSGIGLINDFQVC